MYEQAAAKGGSDGAEIAYQERAKALAKAVHTLRALGSNEAKKRLEAFEGARAGKVLLVQHAHQPTFLSHFDLSSWTCDFPDLFPYGDSQGKYPHLKQTIPCRKLANI